MSVKKSSRDSTLDAIKGIACLLMLAAHLYFPEPRGIFVRALQYMGGLAPALFFAVSGVTATLQAARRPLTQIAVQAAMLALVGISYNVAWDAHLIDGIKMDVPQVIAMGTVAIAALTQWLAPTSQQWLLIGSGIFMLHRLCTPWAINHPQYAGLNLLFSDNGFPLFPWLAMFCFGIVVQRLSNSQRWRVLFITGAAFGLVLKFGGHDVLAKWHMALGYLLLSCTAMVAVFIAGQLLGSISHMRPLLFLGRNSLLFLYVHLFFVFMLKQTAMTNPIALLVSSLLATVLSMNMLLWAHESLQQRWRLEAAPWLIWALLTTIAVVLPLCHVASMWIVQAELVVGIFFALSKTDRPRLASVAVQP